MQMKERFLNAIIAGELGKQSEFGVIVTLKEFKRHFSDVQSAYVNSFLPAAVIEPGQYNISYTKYIFRIRKGLYRVHPQAIEEQIVMNAEKINRIEDTQPAYSIDMYYISLLTGYVNQGHCLVH